MEYRTNQMKHLEWVDMLKGLGILCVVFAHIYEWDISTFIFIFHMPLFFFISGYLHKTDPDYRSFTQKKIIRLLLPYFVFLFVILIPFEIIEVKEPLLKWGIRFFFGGQLLFKWVGVFWFVTCLFITNLVFNYLSNTFSRRSLFIISHIFLLLAYVDSYFFNVPIPWAANITLYALPIYYWGFIYKEKFETYSVTHFTRRILIFSLFVVSVAGYIVRDYLVLNMKSAMYGMPIVSFTFSLLIICLVITVVKYMNKLAIVKLCLSTLGAASMIIMYLHQPIQFILLNYLGFPSYHIRFLIALLIPVSLYFFIKKNKLLKMLLLGKIEYQSKK